MAGRCLVVTYYFPPIGGAGVQRVTKLIKYLSRDGWKFTVVTAREYGSFQPEDDSQLAELPEDIKIIFVDSELPLSGKINLKKVPFFNRSSYWKRWLGAWIAVPDIRKKWISIAQKVILNELSKEQYDCIFVTTPPYSLALLAANLQNLTSKPVILDLRDPWSIHPYKIHPTLVHYYMNRMMEFKIIKNIKFGTSAYAKLLDYYQNHIPGFNTDHWTFIPNGYDGEDFKGLSKIKLENGRFHIGYSGSIHSKINNPQILFKIIADLKKCKPEYIEQIYFHHVGKSQIDLQKISKKYGLEKQVKIWGYHPHVKALEILSAMDSFLLLHDDKFKYSEYIVAGKTYEYLRFQKPILGLVPENGEAAELIRKCNSGVVISPHNKRRIQSVLLDWIQNRPNFQFEDIELYNREKQASQFSQVFEKAISSNNM